MMEDRNGRMWFGTTNGALKYDGHNFKHFTDLDGLNSKYSK
ncbi:MAG: hypothetical protein IPF72_16100 [Chitinophagaceae bacterium]|nr:hypothetical protein [Chitinophagaceae bacterium]